MVFLEASLGVTLLKTARLTSGISVRAAFRIKCSNEGFVVERSTCAFSSYAGNTKQFSTLSFFYLSCFRGFSPTYTVQLPVPLLLLL